MPMRDAAASEPSVPQQRGQQDARPLLGDDPGLDLHRQHRDGIGGAVIPEVEEAVVLGTELLGGGHASTVTATRGTGPRRVEVKRLEIQPPEAARKLALLIRLSLRQPFASAPVRYRP
jgi:hypothetical protein